MELLFVVIAIGIIATVSLLKLDDSATLREAALQIIQDVRYTQHLAMIDDQFSSNDRNWQKKRWTIIFNSDAYSDNKEAYTVFSDKVGVSSGNPDKAEVAKNPLDRERLLSGGFSGISGLNIKKDSFVGTKQCNLGKHYGIQKVVFSKECSYRGSRRISFDHMGRPLKGKLSKFKSPYPSSKKILTKQCKITLTDSKENNISIYIEPETGYVHL